VSALKPRFRPFASGERKMGAAIAGAGLWKKLRQAGARASRTCGSGGRQPRTRDHGPRLASLLNARAQLRAAKLAAPNPSIAPKQPHSPTNQRLGRDRSPRFPVYCYSPTEAAHDLHVVQPCSASRATEPSGSCGLAVEVTWKSFREVVDDHVEDNEDEIEAS